MLVKKITPHLFDIFALPSQNHKTGWEPDLWIRVFVKGTKLEYVKGNKRLLKDASNVMLGK